MTRSGPLGVDTDVDVVGAWAESGGEWLTAPGVAVPQRLVRAVAARVAQLDERGAGLGDITAAGGVGLLAERAAALGLPPASAVSCGGAGRILAAADGWLAVTLARDDDIEMIPAWLGVAAPIGRHWEIVEAAVAERSVADLVAQASLLGLPCVGLGEASLGPGEDPVRRERLGEAPPAPLGELTVVDLGALWAAPLCADVLSRLGARVITVESSARPDGARRTRRFFESLHGRTESVALDLTAHTGRRRLAELLSRIDVVIEASRPRALRQMGIDAYSMTRTGPRLWVSITAHGRSGGGADRVGFGDDAAVAGGLVGRAEARPVFLADAVADPLGGLAAAAEVVALADAGGRHLVDVALARVAASVVDRDVPVLAPSGAPDPPALRRDPGAALPLGRDTDAVLAEFAIA